MASINRPDKITIDAYSDSNLELNAPNGMYNRFTNQLRTPILNAKGIQLLNANFINSILQLNDNSQLVFWYYVQNTATSIRQIGNLKCVRLYPSNFVAQTGYTSFTRNRYFNSVTELVAALNTAASTGGDDVVYNPMWVANQVQFSYDTTTRKISVTSTNANFIAPAPADDPFVIDRLRGTTDPTTRIRMNGYTSSGTYATATLQPYVEGVSMNARLGYAMSFLARGLWWSANSVQGCATSTGIPFATGTLIEADSPPILLGSQNCSIYLSIVTGSGMDATGRKNLIQTIPIEVAPLNINSYTASSVERPAISIPTEIYEITAELLDDYGQPFFQPGNYNTNLAFAVYY